MLGNIPTSRVYWGMPTERQIMSPVVNQLIGVAIMADRHGYQSLLSEYGRVDVARNAMVGALMGATTRPLDWLVMLDDDHLHPPDIVRDLTSTDKTGVVGALARRRGPPHDVLAWTRNGKGQKEHITQWTPGDILPVAIISTSAIAIQRWVFDTLADKGFAKPWFRYAYQDGEDSYPTEDVYFSALCEAAGVPLWLHTGVVIPHATVTWV